MTYYANDVHPVPPDRHADDCDDQLPLVAHVGRGLKGDSAHVDVKNGRVDTHLVGGWIDNADGTFNTDWISDNINGGELRYQYNLNPFTVPRTFTITFIYTRGHEGDENYADWSWTSPAIPYIWRTLDEDGNEHEQPDDIIGTGCATVFARTMHEDWNIAKHERLWYPIDPTTGKPFKREYFNAPDPENPWSVTIRFGHGGDVDVPDFDDIAKIIGISKEDVYDILEDKSVTINGIDAKNLIEYIDKCDRRDRDHFHKDLGFNDEGHGENTFGPSPITNETYSNVKNYIDAADENLRERIIRLEARVKVLEDRLKELGVDDIPSGQKMAYGNINVFSGNESENHYIRTHSGVSDNDLKGM